MGSIVNLEGVCICAGRPFIGAEFTITDREFVVSRITPVGCHGAGITVIGLGVVACGKGDCIRLDGDGSIGSVVHDNIVITGVSMQRIGNIQIIGIRVIAALRNRPDGKLNGIVPDEFIGGEIIVTGFCGGSGERGAVTGAGDGEGDIGALVIGSAGSGEGNRIRKDRQAAGFRINFAGRSDVVAVFVHNHITADGTFGLTDIGLCAGKGDGKGITFR